jgi:copper homeostasis protein
LHVIIRPRGADFLYSDIEFEIIKADIIRARELGADGVVFGCLNAGGSINKERTQEMVELAGPMSTTCHRAFDMTDDPFEALEDLAGLGVDRILTSGLRPSAVAGIELLAQLVEKAGDRIVIMPGVGVNATNIAQLVKATKAREFHVSSKRPVASLMQYKNEKVFMGATPDPSEYEIIQADHNDIKAICAAAHAAASGAR